MTRRAHRRSTQCGYILLPVVLIITVIAAIVFLVSREGAMQSSSMDATSQSNEVEVITKAGLAHATWGAQNSGCAGDMAMTTVPFGQAGTDSYTATVTTPGGTTTAYTLSVDQDTHIREQTPISTAATAPDLKVINDAGNTKHALYRFDLSTLPAGSQINSAVVWLYVTANDDQGPISMHRVTADWDEATASWDNMNGNFDSPVLGMIPPQSANDVWVQVNLTAQVQAWVNGAEPNYGILLQATTDGIESRYASKEWGTASERPRLQVVVGTGPASPVTIKATGTLTGNPSPANDITRTLTRTDVPAYQPPGNVILQLGTDPGEETLLDSFYDQRNYGGADYLQVHDNGSVWQQYPLIRFDLAGLPRGASVRSAQLELRLSSVNAPGTATIHQVTRSWVEGTKSGGGIADGATWFTHDGTSPWTSAGGDIDASVVAETAINGGETWVSWEIAPLVERWLAGAPNYGLLIRPDSALDKARFASKEDANVGVQPKLTITYACECGSACLAPQGSGKIALIGDDSSPDPDDQLKIEIIESWGYEVDFFEDTNSGSINWSLYDLAYVSETVISGDVSANLSNLPIGVVNEEPKLYDDLQLANGDTEHVGSSIDITDNSHYITAPFAAGALSIYTGEMEILTADTPLAGGLQILGEYNGAASLTALDQGAQTTSGTAAGRRVTLPLGQHFASGFDWDYLNANGRLMVQRAIQWGTGNTGGAPPKNLLLVVVDPSSLTVQEAAKKGLIESWGYVVNLIDVDDSQAAFDAAVASNDVVFITEDIASSALGTKLVNANIGVVTEEDNLSDEFGLSAGIAWETDTQVEINDNTHYITLPFPTGLLTILSVAESMAYVTGAQSPDLGKLASSASGFNIVTLEAGAATYTGGFAAGRRVQLPWGNNDFDLNHFNADGRTILQRALEWGAGAGAAAPQSILFVVPDATALGAQDAVKQTLMESWGYNVVLITAADSQTNFDAAVASADVAYISEEVTSSDIGTKLRDVTIGVVNEETALTDEFGIAGTRTGYTGTDIEVVDTTHYITSVFASGPLTIASSATELNRLTGSLAPGLDALAETTGNPELVTIETGGLLYDGGTAAGRRVQLPWGATAFDINLLNTDGQTLMRRAIEWGASVASLSGPIAHWKLDDGAGSTAVDSEGGHDGTLTGGPAWTAGQLGGALNFDGVNDYVDVGTFDVSGSGLTMMGWLNADTIPTSDPRIISKANGTNETDAWWQLSTTDSGSNRYLRVRIKAGGTTTTFADSSVNLTAGQWYFAVATYDNASGNMKLYLDGIEVASGPHAVGGPVNTGPAVPVAIGANGTAERFFDGILDDMRVYDRALGATEISDLFSAGGGGGGGGGPTIVEVRVATGNDDAEERLSNGNVNRSSSDLELISDGSNAQHVGMRFTGVAVPNGATITNAWIQFQVDETNSGATNVNIQGEAIDSALQFTTSSYNISSRSKTTASIPWAPVSWTTVGEAGPDQRTPDISAAIQEIVSRPGWASGNDMVIIISGSGERTAESYNGDASGAALLHIEY